MTKCSGCGAILQTENKEGIGYIPEDKISSGNLCERCFRILHYNDLKLIDLPCMEDVLTIVNQSNKFAFFMVDLLNINLEVVETYHKIKRPKLFIVSKVDFIPKYIKKEKIKIWLKEEYGIEEEILFLSVVKNLNVQAILRSLENSSISEGYLLGYTNSGKSTLVNCLTNTSNITTSLVPNTTVNFIKIPFENGVTLFDTPGFLYKDTLYKQEDLAFLKKIHPKTFLKPITFQLKKGASIVIENYIRIENESNKCNLTIYMSNLLEIKKVYEKNSTLKQLPKLSLSVAKNQDLVFKGIGFINCKSDANVNVYIKGEEFLEVRHSFFER